MQEFVNNLDDFMTDVRKWRFGRRDFLRNFTCLSFGDKIKAAQKRITREQRELEKKIIIEFVGGLTEEEIKEWLCEIYAHEENEDDWYR